MNKRAANLDGRTGGDAGLAGRPTNIDAVTDRVYMTDLQRCFAQGAKMKVETKPKVDYTPAELDAASRLLLKGADLIETRGHHKGGYSDGHRICFRGSLHLAATGDPVYGTPDCDEASVRFLGYMRKNGQSTEGGWLKWNDDPARTAEEVISAMRAVALGL